MAPLYVEEDCVCVVQDLLPFERVQFRELMVVKKNGRKSAFDRDKLAKSIYIALKKRPLDTETVEKFISRISRSLRNSVRMKLQVIQLEQWSWKV